LGPHATPAPTFTYTVTTTSDDTLAASAPAHLCEDNSNHSLCSYRAAIAVATNDFNSSGANGSVSDLINIPAGDYELNAKVGPSVQLANASFGGNLSIEGAAASSTIIDGETLDFGHELLGINGGNTTIAVSGLTFRGGYSSNDGGAIWLAYGDSLAISQCDFEDDQAANQGGAIGADTDTNLTISVSKFSNNVAPYGGGALSDASTESIILSADAFTNNQSSKEGSPHGGGAVLAAGNAEIDHSQFLSNSSYAQGGAISIGGVAVLATDTFAQNTSVNSDGGAIFASQDTLLTSSQLTRNNAGNGGGAVYAAGNISMLHDAFTSNGAAQSGGDIFNSWSADIQDTNFTGSLASTEGGSIFSTVNAGLQLNNDSFVDALTTAIAGTSGGGAIYLDGPGHLFGVTIQGSSSTSNGYGGGIQCNSACNLTLANCAILHDSSGVAGGGIYIDGGHAVIELSTVSQDRSGWGGGVAVDNGGSLLASQVTLSKNVAVSAWGGGIAVDGASAKSTVSISSSTLEMNEGEGASIAGGGLALYDDSSGSIMNDTFALNAASLAGAIYAYESNLTIESSTFAQNSATVGDTLLAQASQVTSTSTIWSGSGTDQCELDSGSTLNSGGFNLASGASCLLDGIGDVTSPEMSLGELGDNGGPTPTVEPISGSMAIGSGGTACPITDQRGLSVPLNQRCDIGAVFVEPTKTSLRLSSSSAVYGHEQLEKLTIVVTPVVNNSRPTGLVSIYSAATRVCATRLRPQTSSRSGSYEGVCSLSPRILRPGSRALVAEYTGNRGLLAASASGAKKVRIVA
jgi:predicted outer membrane repeat protein